MSSRRERLARARLYLVCDDQPDARLRAALLGGVDIVQLRMKGADDEAIVAAGRRFAEICAEHDALFIVNDRPDLVAPTAADGVHLGQDDGPVADALRTVGGERLIGLSTHTPEQVDAAAGLGADYIGVGPVNETPTKPGRPAVGLALVGYAATHAQLPFFAIGGISPSNIDAVRDAGAGRVAVVRALVHTAEPELVARRLRDALIRGERRQEARVGSA